MMSIPPLISRSPPPISCQVEDEDDEEELSNFVFDTSGVEASYDISKQILNKCQNKSLTSDLDAALCDEQLSPTPICLSKSSPLPDSNVFNTTNELKSQFSAEDNSEDDNSEKVAQDTVDNCELNSLKHGPMGELVLEPQLNLLTDFVHLIEASSSADISLPVDCSSASDKCEDLSSLNVLNDKSDINLSFSSEIQDCCTLFNEIPEPGTTISENLGLNRKVSTDLSETVLQFKDEILDLVQSHSEETDSDLKLEISNENDIVFSSNGIEDQLNFTDSVVEDCHSKINDIQPSEFSDEEFTEFTECEYTSAPKGDFCSLSNFLKESFVDPSKPCDSALVLCLSDEVRKCNIWKLLSCMEVTPALNYQWTASYTYCKLLSSLKIDSRNILLGSWNKSSFKTQEETKEEENEESLLHHCGDVPLSKCLVPNPHFDWDSSGLVNPLDCGSAALLDSKLLTFALSSKSSWFISTPCVCPQRKKPASVISQEVEAVVSKFPDYSFMMQKVILFPKKNHT